MRDVYVIIDEDTPIGYVESYEEAYEYLRNGLIDDYGENDDRIEQLDENYRNGNMLFDGAGIYAEKLDRLN